MKLKLKKALSLLACFCLAVGLLTISPLSATAADNLAANGDLELGSASGWEIASAQVDSGVKYAGNYSLKLTATSAYMGAAYKIVPVGKGATVTVSFYYRYESAPGDKLYHVYTYQGVNAEVGPYTGGADASFKAPTGCEKLSDWKQISYTFNSGDYANIYLKFAPNGSGGTPCYIDNLVVTSQGGVQEEIAPYLTSFGTKYNRPVNPGCNLISNSGFESVSGAPWNTPTFLNANAKVVKDDTAREGNHSLFYSANDFSATRFSVAVEQYTQYTFSAWVKSPRLSETNQATATFGVADVETGDFLVYEPYNGNGHGSASLSTPHMQLMATAPDDEWHLRSVTFYSGTATAVYVAIAGIDGQLYLDDIALYKSAYGVEYISALRIGTITAQTNTGHKYCADVDSLIPAPHMTGMVARDHWSSNPAWRNGFLSFDEVGGEHGTVLAYENTPGVGLAYIDWIDVMPNTAYTFTVDVYCAGSHDDSRIALLDDNINYPAEFYTISLCRTDKEWTTYSITFNSGVYSRVGLAIIDFGGSSKMDNMRLFESSKGIADQPNSTEQPFLMPTGGETSTVELSKPTDVMRNGGFEQGWFDSWDVYQNTSLSADEVYSGIRGAHMRGDGSWGAMLEQKNIPVEDGATYVLSYWYKANANGANITLRGAGTGKQYAYEWAANGAWTRISATFTVEGDTALIFNACGGGNGVAEDVYLDEVTLTTSKDQRLGVGFLMNLKAQGATHNERFVGDLSAATVEAYGDGEAYRLVKMGALMTNKASVGSDPTTFMLTAVSADQRVVDAPAIYLYDVTQTAVTFAVRVVNIPFRYADVVIYARPYYVFEKNGEEVVVYGDIYRRSYNDRGQDVHLG